MDYENLTNEEQAKIDTAFNDAKKFAEDTITYRGASKSSINKAIQDMFIIACCDKHFQEARTLLTNLDFKQAEIRKHEKNAQCIAHFGCIPHSTREMVEAWVKSNDLSIDLQGNAYLSNNADREAIDDAQQRFIVDASDYCSIYKMHTAKSAWGLKVKELKEKFRSDLVRGIKFNKTIETAGQLELQRFVSAFLDKDETDFEVAVQSINAFIWMVKRKQLGLDVNNHVMVVFVGEQGGGKTTNMLKLLSPLDGACAPANFRQIQDDRYNAIFDMAAIYIDEMSYLSTSHSGMLKNILTSQQTSNRPLFSNHVSTKTNRASFIGASNTSIAQMFYDPTGMRRFVELYCLSKKRADWDTINDINIELIWKSVDENANVNPIQSVQTKLDAIQEEARQKCPVEQWLVHHICTKKIDCNESFTAADLFEQHAEIFLDNISPKHGLDRRKFGNKLADIIRTDAYRGVMVKLQQRSKKGLKYQFNKDGVDSIRKQFDEGERRIKADEMIDIIHLGAA